MVVLHVRSAAPASASSSPSQDGDEETEFLYEYAALGALAGLHAALLSHSAGASDSERVARVLLVQRPPPCS